MHIPLLWHFPVSIYCLLAGLTSSGFAEQVTGLSRSHLRPGKVTKLRPSTLNRVHTNTENFLRKKMAAKDWSQEEIDEWLAALPSRADGEPSPFQALVHGLTTEITPYHATRALAGQIDSLDQLLVDAVNHEEPSRYRDAILGCDWLDHEDWWTYDSVTAKETRKRLSQAEGWHELGESFKPVVFNIRMAFLASIDVEFGNSYFSPLVARPLFLDLLPKLASLVEDGQATLKGPRLILPVRRLLELSHAMYIWQKEGKRKWLAKPGGCKAIGNVIGESDRDVGKLFNGSRKLTSARYQHYWECMFDQLPPERGIAAPMPLLMAARYWQETLIGRSENYKSISSSASCSMVPTEYMKWWSRYQGKMAMREGAHSWPTWLTG